MSMGAQNQIHGKEVLRIMVKKQPKKLIVLSGIGSTKLFGAHPLVEDFNREHGTGLTVVSLNVAYAAISIGIEGTPIDALCGFPVDASIAYEKHGKRLGKEIVFPVENNGKVILATGKYKGEKNVALVALGLSPADFKKDGHSVVLDIHETRLIIVPTFPGKDGFYMPHKQTGVPHGRKAESNPGSKYLVRLYDSSYVGLQVCLTDTLGIGACNWPSCTFGVVAEVPEKDISSSPYFRYAKN
jgi:hypothetical protein